MISGSSVCVYVCVCAIGACFGHLRTTCSNAALRGSSCFYNPPFDARSNPRLFIGKATKKKIHKSITSADFCQLLKVFYVFANSVSFTLVDQLKFTEEFLAQTQTSDKYFCPRTPRNMSVCSPGQVPIRSADSSNKLCRNSV